MGKYNDVIYEKYGIKMLEDCNTSLKKCFGIDSEGYILGVRYADLKNGTYPDKVSPSNPYTIQNIKHYLYINNINQILISDKYEKSQAKLDFYCPVHKTPYKQSWSKLNAGINCQKCGYERMASKARKSRKDFIKQANEIHDFKYTYENVEYKNYNTYVIITCPEIEHGEFRLTPHSHLMGIGCSKCTGNHKLNNEEFVRKATLKHNGKYDYSKSEFVDRDIELEIICTEHGSFWETPNNHLRNTVLDKCPDCASKSRYYGSGWSKSKWKEAGEKSSNFESYKLYVIKCFDDNESFIKVGRTFRTMKERFGRKKRMPYKYEIIQIFESQFSDLIFDLENKIQKQLKYKNLEHSPEIQFDGITECFKDCVDTIVIIEENLLKKEEERYEFKN